MISHPNSVWIVWMLWWIWCPKTKAQKTNDIHLKTKILNSLLPVNLHKGMQTCTLLRWPITFWDCRNRHGFWQRFPCFKERIMQMWKSLVARLSRNCQDIRWRQSAASMLASSPESSGNPQFELKLAILQRRDNANKKAPFYETRKRLLANVFEGSLQLRCFHHLNPRTDFPDVHPIRLHIKDRHGLCWHFQSLKYGTILMRKGFQWIWETGVGKYVEGSLHDPYFCVAQSTRNHPSGHIHPTCLNNSGQIWHLKGLVIWEKRLSVRMRELCHKLSSRKAICGRMHRKNPRKKMKARSNYRRSRFPRFPR